MQAHADGSETKKLSDEDRAASEKRTKIEEELRMDAELLLSGLRLMNRPRDNAKERFIQTFIQSRAIERFPSFESDLADEAEVSWSSETSLRSMRDVLASEIERAFECAVHRAPATSKVIATKMLGSDTGSNLGILADIPLDSIEVDLVLGHIAALGYRWPPRIALAVARRATIVILNRHKFEGRTEQ